MLGREPYKHNQLRKYGMAFGSLFNEIYITREDTVGDRQQVLKVPLSYARKEKILARVTGDPDIDKKAASTIPRMSFEITDLVYNGDNKLGSTRRWTVKSPDDGTSLYRETLNPVPYDIKFNLYIFTKNQEDGNQIVEQILPYFTPFFPMSIEILPEMGVVIDVPVTLDGNHCEDLYDGDYKQRRAVVWTLQFTMTTQIFGPVRRHPLIKFANVSFYDATLHEDIDEAVGNTPAIDRVTVQPGQDANGNATDQLALTVSYQDIEADENWDYIVTVYGDLSP